jgi:hypothetical protein
MLTAKRQKEMPEQPSSSHRHQKSNLIWRTYLASPAAATATAARTSTTAPTAAAATITAAIAAAPTAAATTRPIGLGTSFVDGEIPASQVGAIQSFHCLVRRLIVGHLDEGEASGLSAVAVGNDADPVNWAIGLEHAAYLIFSRIEA